MIRESSYLRMAAALGLLMTTTGLLSALLFAWVRRDFSTPLLAFVGPLFVLGAIWFSPLALPARGREWLESCPQYRPIPYIVVFLSPALLGPFPSGWLLAAYGAIALVGGTRAVRLLRHERALALPLLLPLALAIVLFVFDVTTRGGLVTYAPMLAPEYGVLGLLNIDTYYHSAIANMIAGYGVPSTGVDGLVLRHYHVGSHFWMAGLSRLIGASGLMAYAAGKYLVMLPSLFGALVFSSTELSRRDVNLARTALVTTALAAFLTQWSGLSVYVSESHAMGLTVLLFALPVLVAVNGSAAARGDHGLRPLLFILAITFPLWAFKVSIGYVWTGLAAWVCLRRCRFSLATLAGLATLVGMGLVAWALFVPGGTGPSIAFFPFVRQYGLHWLLDNLFPPLAVAVLAALYCWLRVDRYDHAADEPGPFHRSAAELLVLAVVLGVTPAAFMNLRSAEYYFVSIAAWMAVAILVALLSEAMRQHGRPDRFLFGVGGMAAVLLAGQLVTNAPVPGSERGVTHRYIRELPKAQFPLGRYGHSYSKVRRRLKAVGSVVADVRSRAQEGPGRLAVHAPFSNKELWGIDRCRVPPFFFPALAGVAGIAMRPPEETRCNRTIGHGFPSYWDSPMSDIGDRDALCRHALQKGFERIYLAHSLSVPARNEVLDCTALLSHQGDLPRDEE